VVPEQVAAVAKMFAAVVAGNCCSLSAVVAAAADGWFAVVVVDINRQLDSLDSSMAVALGFASLQIADHHNSVVAADKLDPVLDIVVADQQHRKADEWLARQLAQLLSLPNQSTKRKFQ
jgi:hypothetical protein